MIRNKLRSTGKGHCCVGLDRNACLEMEAFGYWLKRGSLQAEAAGATWLERRRPRVWGVAM